MTPPETDITARWQAAQVAEHAYHCRGDTRAARTTSRQLRRWYAAMLDIPLTCDRALYPQLVPCVVAEFGCGPVGLVLESPRAGGGSYAIDPLTFDEADEGRYAARAMVRVREPGERVGALAFDEAWVCNCLQHTLDPDAVWSQALRAAQAVRVFEWVGVPTDRLHLHTLAEGQLTGPLAQAGFACVGETRGERAKRHPTHGDEWRQRFYAGVWVRA